VKKHIERVMFRCYALKARLKDLSMTSAKYLALYRDIDYQVGQAISHLKTAMDLIADYKNKEDHD